MTAHDRGGKEERNKKYISEGWHPFMRLLTLLTKIDVGISFRRIYLGLWVLETDPGRSWIGSRQ